MFDTNRFDVVAVPVIARVVPVAFTNVVSAWRSVVPVIVVLPAMVTVSSCPMRIVDVPDTSEPLAS